jgi:hypothetical protein
MVLMVVAFVSMVGLMYWLSQNAEPSAVAMPQEEAVEDRLETVSAADFGMDPMAYSDREIRLPGVSVASRLGSQSFWIQVPRQAQDGTIVNQPYLVHMDSTVYSTVRVSAGETVAVEGIVIPMSDSILSAWEAAGAFDNPSNRIEAEFATDFIQASAVEIRTPSGTSGGEG